MSDAEIIRALAERVMGWHGMFNCWFNNWNPLASDTDAFMVLDKIGDRFCDIILERSGENWTVTISTAWWATDTDRRRAMATAALRWAERELKP